MVENLEGDLQGLRNWIYFYVRNDGVLTLEVNKTDDNLRRICQTCGREFQITDNRMLYCSKGCQLKAVRANFLATLPTRKCIICGKEFKPKASAQKYCSPECSRPRQERKKPPKIYKKICLVCGKEFETTVSTRRYCSDECTVKARTSYKKICLVCGKEFTTTNFRRVYCSAECGNHGRYLKKMTETATCKFCGKEFLVGYKIRPKFCSQKCQKQFEKANKRTETLDDVMRKADECGLSYGQYQVQTRLLGKTYEELKAKYEKEKAGDNEDE